MKRREFLKKIGLGGVALTAAACAPKSVLSEDGGIERGEMEMRTNPRTGDRVSLLGYGCMRWPMTLGPDGEEIIDQEKVNALVDKAIANGVNFFDMSPAYLRGECEKATGIALARHPRSSYFVSTKLSNFGDASREASLKMYYDSFTEIGVDYIDYYLLHAIGRGGIPAFEKRYVENGMMDFLMEERRKGKIRNLGFSFHGDQQSFDDLFALHEKYSFDFVLIQANYIDWRHADGKRNVNAEYLYEKISAAGLKMLVMEPLQGGRLANIPVEAAQILKEAEPQRSIASWAFRFVGTHPAILTILSGMTYDEHLEDNLDTFCGFKPLSSKELALLENVAVKMTDPKFPTVGCNGCKYCMPCPYGVDIAGIFAHYNKAVYSEMRAESREQENYEKLRRRYLISYDRSIETLRQANHCIGCGQCLEHCPQSLDIPRELRKIDLYVEKLKRNTL